MVPISIRLHCFYCGPSFVLLTRQVGEGAVFRADGPCLNGEALLQSVMDVVKLPVPSVDSVSGAILAGDFYDIRLPFT